MVLERFLRVAQSMNLNSQCDCVSTDWVGKLNFDCGSSVYSNLGSFPVILQTIQYIFLRNLFTASNCKCEFCCLKIRTLIPPALFYGKRGSISNVKDIQDTNLGNY